MTDLEEFRKQKDEYLEHSSHSPLKPEQRQAFTGLRYFPENPALDLTVSILLFPGKQTIPMPTSTGAVQHYERYGQFSFAIDGQTATLTFYRNANGYFLPFVDSLAGKETYAAGRYLEPKELGAKKFQVNFNYAYNPYCAYNELWSCPIPPAENHLTLPIRAGEMIFAAHE